MLGSVARYLAWVVGQRAAHDQRVEAHRRAVDDAIATGKPPPTEEPRQPVTEQQHADRISLFRARQLTLDEERLTVVAALAPDVVTAARAAYDEALAAAREHVAALTTICAAVNAAQQAVYEVTFNGGVSSITADLATEIATVTGLLWNCTDVLPGEYCALLDLPQGSSYAQAARFVRREMQRSAA